MCLQSSMRMDGVSLCTGVGGVGVMIPAQTPQPMALIGNNRIAADMEWRLLSMG